MNKFSPNLKIVSLFTLLVIHPFATFSHAAEEHGHDHDHEDEHLCACEAKELGFKIDCQNVAVVTASAEYLKTDTKCASKAAKTKECEKNYLILQSHHDYCPHDTLPSAIENDLHAYEEIYTGCSIKRQFDKELDQCPAFDCAINDATARLTEAATLLNNNCSSTCATSDACKTAFQTILMAHDTCDKKIIPGTAETTLHLFEDKCESHLCNSLSNPYDLNGVKCPEDAVSSAPPRGGSSIGNVLALAAVGSAVFVFS